MTMPTTTGEFFSECEELWTSLYRLNKLSNLAHELGLIESDTCSTDSPKWARRKKGEKRESDRYDYGLN